MQQIRQRAIRVGAGFMDRPESRLLLRIWIGAGIEHGLHDLEVASSDRRMQRLNLQAILRGRVHISARCDQAP